MTIEELKIEKCDTGYSVTGLGYNQFFDWRTGRYLETIEQAEEVRQLIFDLENTTIINEPDQLINYESEQLTSKITKLEKQLTEAQLAIAEIFETITGGN